MVTWIRLLITMAFVFPGVVAWCIPTSAVAELTAADIVAKVNSVQGGDDSISRLTFSFQKSDGSEKKLIYTMVWKAYGGKDDTDHKVIFFSEYPPADKGKSYMIWIYEHKQDEEWMYLPELRTVRRITHDESHHYRDEDDDFSNSVITGVDLVQRDPTLDNHTLLNGEDVDGHSDYVVESVPKVASKYPYQKIRRWITKDNFLPERIDYYGGSGNVEKRETIRWRKIGDAWVWEQVVGVDLKSNDRTVLDISDIRLNNGLTDDIFSARTLLLGKDSLSQ